jgi:hypothetical protein
MHEGFIGLSRNIVSILVFRYSYNNLILRIFLFLFYIKIVFTSLSLKLRAFHRNPHFVFLSCLMNPLLISELEMNEIFDGRLLYISFLFTNASASEEKDRFCNQPIRIGSQYFYVGLFFLSIG